MSLKAQPLLIITRSQHDSEIFLKNLDAPSAKVMILPLYEYEYFSPALPVKNDCDRVILTSSKAIPYISEHREFFKRLKFSCVGETTGKKIKEAGFSVSETGDCAKELLPKLKQENVKDILYIRGEDISFNFAGSFSGPEESYREVITYKAVPAEEIFEDITPYISENQDIIITLFSARAAVILEKMIEKQGYASIRTRTKLLSISKRVLESLKYSDWKKTYVSDRPDTKGMYALIENVMNKTSD